MNNPKNPRAIQVTLEGDVYPTGAELAEVFWAMVESDQVDFFSKLWEISDNRLCFQLQAIIDHRSFNDDAKRAMQMIGEYGEGQQ